MKSNSGGAPQTTVDDSAKSRRALSFKARHNRCTRKNFFSSRGYLSIADAIRTGSHVKFDF